MITVKRIQLPITILLIFILLLILTVPQQYLSHYLLVRSAVAFVDNVDIEWMGYTSKKIVALTFDDGPDPRYTPRILAILAKYQVPATFFLVGANVKSHPQLVAAELAAGHEIGNHTLTHPHLNRLTAAKIKTQIAATDREIAKTSSQTPAFFRPPYEELTEKILIASRESGKKIIMSTITLEHRTLHNPKDQARRVVNLAFPGAIILAHDGRTNRAETVAALPYVIEGLKAKGYQIVPLSVLLRQNL